MMKTSLYYQQTFQHKSKAQPHSSHYEKKYLYLSQTSTTTFKGHVQPKLFYEPVKEI